MDRRVSEYIGEWIDGRVVIFYLLRLSPFSIKITKICAFSEKLLKFAKAIEIVL